MVEQSFQDRASTRFESFGKKVDERFNRSVLGQGVPRVEEELKKLIARINDQVVPQLRQDSADLLHSAADHLRQLAEQLDRANHPGAR